MKKVIHGVLVVCLALLFAGCSTVSDLKSSESELLLIANNRENEEVIQAGESVVFSILNPLPESISENDISWYVNDEKQETTGRTLTVVTAKDINLGYSAYAVIDTPAFRAKSKPSRCIAVADMKNKDYALAYYKYVDKIKETRGIEEIPGLSLAIYGKDGEIDFEIYDGYAHLGNHVKNTKETKHILCSVSKPLVAYAFLKLMNEEGSNLSIDQKISDFLTEDDLDPEHTGKVMSKINMDATVANLMRHTSGIDEYLGVNIVVDLLSKEKDGFWFNLLGKVLMGRNPQYPYTEDWAPYKTLPYIMTKAGTIGVYKYSTPNYILLGMIVEKILNERHPGITIGQYINDNFVLPYCDEPIILAPVDIDDSSFYTEALAGQNIYDSEVAGLIKTYTAMNPAITKLLGINKEGKKVFNFEDVYSSINEAFCKSCWVAGGFIADANQVARIGYYTISRDTEDKKNTDIRELTGVGWEDEVFIGFTYGIYRRTLTDQNGENPVDFYGHNGKIIGESNSMMYDEANDFCIGLLIDSNTPEDDFNSLLYDIHLAGLKNQ